MGCSELWCGCHSKTVVTLGYVWPCWGRLLLQSRLFWHLFRNDEKRRGRWAHDEMKSNGHWNSKNPKDLAVFGLVPALAIFGPCQPLEVWIRRLFIERHLLLPYVFDKMASRFQIFQSETLLGTGRETFFFCCCLASLVPVLVQSWAVHHLSWVSPVFANWQRTVLMFSDGSEQAQKVRLSYSVWGSVQVMCHRVRVAPTGGWNPRPGESGKTVGGPAEGCQLCWAYLAVRLFPFLCYERDGGKPKGYNQLAPSCFSFFLLPYSLPSVNSGRIWLFISWIHFFLNR